MIWGRSDSVLLCKATPGFFKAYYSYYAMRVDSWTSIEPAMGTLFKTLEDLWCIRVTHVVQSVQFDGHCQEGHEDNEKMSGCKWKDNPRTPPKTTRNTYFANSSVPGNVCRWYNITCETKYQLCQHVKIKMLIKNLNMNNYKKFILLFWGGCPFLLEPVLIANSRCFETKPLPRKSPGSIRMAFILGGGLPPHWNPLSKHVLASSKLHISRPGWVSKVGLLQALWH